MKSLTRTLVVATTLLLLTSPLRAVQTRDWIKFAPADGGFTVLMPTEPKETPSKPIEDFTSHFFGALAENGVYLVGYGDYAQNIHLNPEAELIANRDNFL